MHISNDSDVKSVKLHVKVQRRINKFEPEMPPTSLSLTMMGNCPEELISNILFGNHGWSKQKVTEVYRVSIMSLYS